MTSTAGVLHDIATLLQRQLHLAAWRRPASLTTKKVCPSMATVVPAAKKPEALFGSYVVCSKNATLQYRRARSSKQTQSDNIYIYLIPSRLYTVKSYFHESSMNTSGLVVSLHEAASQQHAQHRFGCDNPKGREAHRLSDGSVGCRRHP